MIRGELNLVRGADTIKREMRANGIDLPGGMTLKV